MLDGNKPSIRSGLGSFSIKYFLEVFETVVTSNTQCMVHGMD